MKNYFSFDGQSTRKEYAAVGFTSMALKYGLDALVIFLVTGKIWTPIDYLSPLMAHKKDLPGGVLLYLAVLMVPCAWLGLAMSVKRIRSAGLGPIWSLCFLIPFLNYLFMLIFCLLPPRAATPSVISIKAPTPSMATGIFSASFLGCLGMLVFVQWKSSYGNSLFLLTPFLMGLVYGFIYGRHPEYSRVRLFRGSLAVLLVTSGFFLLFALEGIFCIAMIAPVALVVISFGSLIGAELARKTTAAPVHILPLLFFTGVLGVLEKDQNPPLRKVSTSLIIQAPIQAVWEHVIKFPELPEPPAYIQKSGIAYPRSARIEGTGVGAIRYCEFSTGPFVEPITAWEAPTRLAFAVTQSPPPMKEWNPFHDISPPHLDGYFRSRQGEFKLEAISEGETRVIGSTWYTLEIYPGIYWNLWADAIIHRIHRSVLNHVKNLAEAQQ